MSQLWQNLQSQAPSIALALVLFGCLLGVAETWARLGSPRPESTRKLVHVGAGLICLGFPWMFRTSLPVLLLAIVFSGFFAIAKRWGGLASLHRVGRKTRGTEYYPLAIWCMFLLAGDEAWLFIAGMLVLALADGFAALTGRSFGRHKYTVENNQKSVEGSAAFFAVGLAAIALPALALSDHGPLTCLGAALLAALVLTGFEAISLEGADNLFVPIATVVILDKITSKDELEIAYQLASLVTLASGMGLIAAWSRALNVGGALTWILLTYAAWSLGSEWWALPVFSGFGFYCLFRARLWTGAPAWNVRVRKVYRPALVPFLLLLLHNLYGWNLYDAFVAVVGCIAALVLWSRHAGGTGSRRLLVWLWAIGIAEVCLLPILFGEASLPGVAAGAFSALAVMLGLHEIRCLQVLVDGVPDWTPSQFWTTVISAVGATLWLQPWST